MIKLNNSIVLYDSHMLLLLLLEFIKKYFHLFSFIEFFYSVSVMSYFWVGWKVLLLLLLI